MIERMGVGMRAEMTRLTPSDVDRFLGHGDWYRSNMRQHAGDGRAEATETLHRFIDELANNKKVVVVRTKKPRRKAAARVIASA
jgi:hypothetical protein